ncbi:MAG: hypothetical protein D6830_06970 [Ignavibacteria bacterium]|nr:MAG: hypothetical protein D6830_06970 [Ignavibacteria bacterium]
MKTRYLVLLFFLTIPLFAQHTSQLNFSYFNETNISGFGFGVYERESISGISLAAESRISLISDEGENSTTFADFIVGLGATYSLVFSENQEFVPFVGATAGIGYIYGDNSVEQYAPNDETLQNNIENRVAPIADGAYFYYNLKIGIDWVIGGYLSNPFGLNISYNIGNYNRITAGFTTDMHIIENLF